MDVRNENLVTLNDESSRISQDHLGRQFKDVRNFTLFLTDPLETEDYVVQAMDNTSPVKWHLAHVSWFFETFVLQKALTGYESPYPQYGHIFNSYYLQAGEPHTRSKRGLLARPTVLEVLEYRRYINQQILRFISEASEDQFKAFGPVIEVGIHHEQQHQELILTDLKYMFGKSPLYPTYKELVPSEDGSVQDINWVTFEEGVYRIGNEEERFAYDNEYPRHRRFLEAYQLSDRLVTNAEYEAFINDGGYERPQLWLDEGWATVNREGWKAPLYWEKRDREWYNFTLSGLRKINPAEPVTHLSYYEADAYARWCESRLPTEAEWEVAARQLSSCEGNFVEAECFHPRPLQEPASGMKQMFGDVWEWTSSAYEPYPGYTPLPGALGEYNGKFMCSQYVLRGGSCATSKTHIRETYRNFFYPDARWQFSGLRLARTAV